MGCPCGLTEPRVLKAVVGATVAAALVMLIAVATDHWVYVTMPEGYTHDGAVTLGWRSGLWRSCHMQRHNVTASHSAVTSQSQYEDVETCARLELFPSQDEVAQDDELTFYILNYMRAETAFAVIAMGLMCLSFVFSFYSVKEPRYMFKRVTALLHFMIAACVLVCVEVFHKMMQYQAEFMPTRHPPGSHYQFGASFVLTWLVFLGYLAAGVIMLILGRKRKGDRARSAMEALENEPVNLGRV